MLAERLDTGEDVISSSIRDQTDAGRAEPSKVWHGSRRGMLGHHFLKHLPRVQETRAVQSRAGLGIRALPTEVNAPLVAQGLVELRGPAFAWLIGAILGDALPQRAPLPI